MRARIPGENFCCIKSQFRPAPSMFFNDLYFFLYSVPDEFRSREGRSRLGYASAIREDNAMDEMRPKPACPLALLESSIRVFFDFDLLNVRPVCAMRYSFSFRCSTRRVKWYRRRIAFVDAAVSRPSRALIVCTTVSVCCETVNSPFSRTRAQASRN